MAEVVGMIDTVASLIPVSLELQEFCPDRRQICDRHSWLRQTPQRVSVLRKQRLLQTDPVWIAEH